VRLRELIASAAKTCRAWLATRNEIIGRKIIGERWEGKLLDRGTCEVQVWVLSWGQSYNDPLEQGALLIFRAKRINVSPGPALVQLYVSRYRGGCLVRVCAFRATRTNRRHNIVVSRPCLNRRIRILGRRRWHR
jgi:hypothetical protein